MRRAQTFVNTFPRPLQSGSGNETSQTLPTEMVYTLFHDHAHIEVQYVFIETDNLVATGLNVPVSAVVSPTVIPTHVLLSMVTACASPLYIANAL